MKYRDIIIIINGISIYRAIDFIRMLTINDCIFFYDVFETRIFNRSVYMNIIISDKLL